jgi:uncharacterized protein (DUF3084 family)
MATLTAKFKKAGIDISQLQAKIAELQIDINQEQGTIADLKSTLDKKNGEITQLNTTVAEQKTVISSKEQKIADQTAEINKAYIAVGSVKDLTTKGIVTKEGGFLGIGAKQVLHFTDKLYSQVDLTLIKTIAVNAKSATLVTNHPAGSYKVVLDKDKKVTGIEITDPALFWKASKYVVVEIR